MDSSSGFEVVSTPCHNKDIVANVQIVEMIIFISIFIVFPFPDLICPIMLFSACTTLGNLPKIDPRDKLGIGAGSRTPTLSFGD